MLPPGTEGAGEPYLRFEECQEITYRLVAVVRWGRFDFYGSRIQRYLLRQTFSDGAFYSFDQLIIPTIFLQIGQNRNNHGLCCGRSSAFKIIQDFGMGSVLRIEIEIDFLGLQRKSPLF